MSKNYWQFFPKILSFIKENLNRNDPNSARSSVLSAYRSLFKDSKHLVTIKSAYSRFGNALNYEIDLSVEKFTSAYDRITGRDSVTKAYADLRKAEQDFVAKQLTRRTLQQSLFDIQKKRSEANEKVKATSIADDSYLSLITKEHELAREEARLSMEHREADSREKAAYENFTRLMRYQHAEERNYEQRMRIWALIGSVVVGIFSAFVAWLRYRTPQTTDIRNSIDMIKEVSFTQAEIRSRLDKLNENLQKQQTDASQVREKIAKMESTQEKILSALKTFGAASQNISYTFGSIPGFSTAKSSFNWLTSSIYGLAQGNETKESSDLKRSDEEEATGYFGWKSVIGTVAVLAVVAICII